MFFILSVIAATLTALAYASNTVIAMCIFMLLVVEISSFFFLLGASYLASVLLMLYGGGIAMIFTFVAMLSTKRVPKANQAHLNTKSYFFLMLACAISFQYWATIAKNFPPLLPTSNPPPVLNVDHLALDLYLKHPISIILLAIYLLIVMFSLSIFFSTTLSFRKIKKNEHANKK